MSGQTLLSEIWEDGEGDETRLRVLVKRLREKIEPDAGEPRVLLNERGMGYRLVISKP